MDESVIRIRATPGRTSFRLDAMPPDRENCMAIWLPEMPVFGPLQTRLGEPHEVGIARR